MVLDQAVVLGLLVGENVHDEGGEEQELKVAVIFLAKETVLAVDREQKKSDHSYSFSRIIVR